MANSYIGKNENMGLYIHIPFCQKKCAYCDFYSFLPEGNQMDSYLKAVLSSVKEWSKKIEGTFSSVYFGGGTPSFFGASRLTAILNQARECFNITPDAEITAECNPSSVNADFFSCLRRAGFNRLSMGLQSALDAERKAIGRQSTAEQAKTAVRLAKENGFSNISIDLMLGLPRQTEQTLTQSLDFIRSAGVTHVSAYILNVEPGTPLYRSNIVLPSDDDVCDLYLFAAQKLEDAGFKQYEISNFAQPGYQSRHNLNYWHCGQYLGVGPAAHSFFGGRRFFYPADIDSFIGGAQPIDDGEGGDEEEYIMLALRLTSGVEKDRFFARYKKQLPEKYIIKAKKMQKYGIVVADENGIRLTKKGFLVSNKIISEILF